MFTGKKILITDGVARQVLPIVKGLKKLGCHITIICFSKLDVGYSTKYADERILLSCKESDIQYQEQYVLNLIQNQKFDLVIPMSDETAEYLSRNKESISKYAAVAVNDYDIFKLAANKNNTMRICQENGISCPKTYLNLREVDFSELPFPVVVKPETGCGSIGFKIVQDVDHLNSVIREYEQKNYKLCIQEYIPQNGPQFGAEVFRDKYGNFSFLVIDEKPRWFPLDGGSPTINISIHDKTMKEMSEKLLNTMQWEGYANIDFVLDKRDKQPKILEVNPRLSAATKLNYCLGIDVARAILENAFNDKVTEYEDYEDGIAISCCLTELLWFVKSSNRFKTKPSIFTLKDKSDVIFDSCDIVPFIKFCIQSLLKYRKAMKLRER